MGVKGKNKISRRGGIDPAALAGASLAGALSVFATPGPYAPGSMIIGLTLLFLILGYDVDPDREMSQSIAFSAVLGLVCILIIGWPLEVLFAGDRLGRFKVLIRERPHEQDYSEVPPVIILLIWLTFTALSLLYDRYRAKSRKAIAIVRKVKVLVIGQKK